MKAVLLIGIATICFAAEEPVVSLASLKSVEASIGDRLKSSINDPYDLLGEPRGTYLDGYGAVFTVYVDLVVGSPLNFSPFRQSVSEKELADLHDHKARKVEALKTTMREMIASASRSLPGLAPNERIVMEAFLFNYRWEQTRGLPHRIVLTAYKQKLLDAVNRNVSAAELTALFTEEEL